jgi:hypothetical protein
LPEIRRLSLAKPTIQTRYHIDFGWWSQTDNDWRVFLQGLLCPDHQRAFSDSSPDEMVDWIDPQTAMVYPVDGIQHILISHCAKQPGFLNPRTALVDGVFRVFLANGNSPLTSVELAERLNRTPDIILRTISGPIVYRGLRPILE